MAGDPPVRAHFNQLTGFDFAFKLRADDIECHGFTGKDDRLAQPPHHQRPDAQRIAAGNHALGRHADQRIGAFNHAQRIDKPVKQPGETAGGDQVNDDFSVRSGLEDRALLDQFLAQMAGVGNVPVVRDGESARRQIGVKRLHIAQPRAAGGRIADVARSHEAGQFPDRFDGGKIFRNLAKPAPGIEFGTVKAGDSRRFLPAMLQSMQAQRRYRSRIGCVDDAENAAFLAQLVAVSVEKRMVRDHRCLQGPACCCVPCGPQWRCYDKITRFIVQGRTTHGESVLPRPRCASKPQALK